MSTVSRFIFMVQVILRILLLVDSLYIFLFMLAYMITFLLAAFWAFEGANEG